MQLNRPGSHPTAPRRPTPQWLAGAFMAVLGASACAGTRAPDPIHVFKAPRPGLYGRIDVRGAPPPLIYPQPVVARRPDGAAQDPVFLYVPPGQVRRWAQHCAKWNACERPVYFVRVDDSPSRMGQWRKAQRAPVDDAPILQALYRLTP